MAGKGDIEAGKAHILLYMKNQLGRGLNAVKAELQSLGGSIMRVGGSLTALGAGLVAPLIAAVAHFANLGSELADLSARTGESVASLAELKFAAEQTGAGLADIETALRNQQKNGVAGTFDQVAASIAAVDSESGLKAR